MSVCLSSPPLGLFRRALCLSLDVYTSLRFPCLISALSFKDQGCTGLRWKKRQFLVKRERKKAVLQRRQQNPTDSEKTLQFMSRGAVCGVFCFKNLLPRLSNKPPFEKYCCAIVLYNWNFCLHHVYFWNIQLITFCAVLSNVHIKQNLQLLSKAISDCLPEHTISRALKRTSDFWKKKAEAGKSGVWQTR